MDHRLERGEAAYVGIRKAMTSESDDIMTSACRNKLYFGDDLEILRDHGGDESVDLIYLVRMLLYSPRGEG